MSELKEAPPEVSTVGVAATDRIRGPRGVSRLATLAGAQSGRPCGGGYPRALRAPLEGHERNEYDSLSEPPDAPWEAEPMQGPGNVATRRTPHETVPRLK